MIKHRYSAVLIFVSLGASFPLSADQELENVYWRLQSIRSEAISLNPSEIPHLAFHQQDNRLAGFGGCNRFFASYQQKGKQLQISIMGGGRARCPETSGIELDFMRALQLTEHFVVQGKGLSLMRGDEILLEFSGIEQ